MESKAKEKNHETENQKETIEVNLEIFEAESVFTESRVDIMGL